MPDQWYAIVERATGRLLSVGTVLPPTPDSPDPLPATVEARPIPAPPADNEMWDEAARTFVPRPPKPSPKTQMTADPAFTALPAASRNVVRLLIDKYFG